jgi:hypothetical protein
MKTEKLTPDAYFFLLDFCLVVLGLRLSFVLDPFYFVLHVYDILLELAVLLLKHLLKHLVSALVILQQSSPLRFSPLL